MAAKYLMFRSPGGAELVFLFYFFQAELVYLLVNFWISLAMEVICPWHVCFVLVNGFQFFIFYFSLWRDFGYINFLTVLPTVMEFIFLNIFFVKNSF